MHVPEQKTLPDAPPHGQKLGMYLLIVTVVFLALLLFGDSLRLLFL